MCTKPRNMRTASRKITRGFDDYSEQAVFQPALHSRITQKKAALACKPLNFSCCGRISRGTSPAWCPSRLHQSAPTFRP